MKTRILTTALFSAIIMTGCQSKENQNITTAQPIKVNTMTVNAGTSTNTGRYSGTVEEENGTLLSFSIAGTIQTLNIRLGQHVQAGQLLATLEETSMQSSYNAAKATLEQAEDAYRRMKELHDKGSLPDIKWIEVQSQVEQARSMEQIAKKSLRDCKLYAPYSGVISEKTVEIGQNVIPGMTVAKLVDASRLQVKIAVPETEIATIAIGQKANFNVSALGGQTFTGTIVEKGITANPLSRSYEVKIQVKGKHDNLMPGMVAEVSFLKSEQNSNTYIIPANIVQIDEQNRTFVWVVQNNKAHRRIISCGEYTAEGVNVVSGLSEGDKIITKGQQKVCEGTEVSL